jgi:stearoyl-CoA desaturase (delta-9 desaturase)
MEWVLVGLVVTAVAVKFIAARAPTPVYRTVLVIGVVGPLAATVFAIVRLWHDLVGWREVGLLVGMYVLTGLGTTLGYHRFATHRSFETGPVVKAVLLILGSMAFQGRVINWTAWHSEHHANSDREGDPHSPLDGFWHAHVGWILRATPAKREKYCKRLLEDRVVVFVDRTTEVWVLVGFVIPYLLAGWTGLLWGGLVRVAVGNHLTFAINSVCHTFGSRAFDTRDASRNNWLMGVIGLGEGWHNNHHAFPSSAFHGLSWRQPDLTGLVIRLLARMRLVWNVKSPPRSAVERRRAVTA